MPPAVPTGPLPRPSPQAAWLLAVSFVAYLALALVYLYQMLLG
ncbi:MAG TPA: hypothetical protein VE965_03400 [Gammaproteobacteria bacterium]|nr:hypothetical protein [Gammaproteobacteria bacterium]